jgi:predicted transcriptional regulator
MKSSPELGVLETRVMQCLWELNEGSVKDVVAHLALGRAYTTVMTTLDRLYKKGLVQRRRIGRVFLYQATFDRVALQEKRNQHYFSSLLADCGDARPILSCFVDTISSHDRTALDELQQLIARKRKELRKK